MAGLEFIVEMPPQAKGRLLVPKTANEIIKQLQNQGYTLITPSKQDQISPARQELPSHLTSPLGNKVEVGLRGDYIYIHFDDYRGTMSHELRISRDLARSAIGTAKSNLPNIFGYH